MDIYVLSEIIVNIIECFILFFLLKNNLNNKANLKNILGTFLLIIFLTFINFKNIDSHINGILMLLLDIIYVYYCFKGNIEKKIFLLLVFNLIVIFSNVSSYLLVSYILNIKQNTPNLEPNSRLILIYISVTFELICYFFAKKLKFDIEKINPLWAILLSILFFLAILSLNHMIGLLIYFENNNMRNLSNSILLFFILFILISIAILISIKKISDTNSKNRKLQTQIEKSSLEQKYINQVTQMITTARTTKHDMNQFIDILTNYANDNDIENIKNLINNNKDYFKPNISFITTSYIDIDAILTQKIMEIKNSNIQLKHEISLPENANFNPFDICIILGNILDNAIESCKKINYDSKKYINIKTKFNNSILVIEVINASNGIYNFMGENIQTTKDFERHGLGLKRISELCEKYDGYFEYQALEDKFISTATINFNYLN